MEHRPLEAVAGAARAPKIGRSRVSFKSVSGIAHSGLPVGARSSSVDLMCGAGARSARADMRDVSGACAIAVAASGAAATTRAPANLGSAEREIILQAAIASRPKWGDGAARRARRRPREYDHAAVSSHNG
jgi:hypothetical protein